MYVCVCRAVTDRQIREAASQGVRTMRELRLKLGVCSTCGKCGECAKQILDSVEPTNGQTQQASAA
jgi:bacterioferritin-associated ferredoxin